MLHFPPTKGAYGKTFFFISNSVVTDLESVSGSSGVIHIRFMV
jgi:hypothetical protein